MIFWSLTDFKQELHVYRWDPWMWTRYLFFDGGQDVVRRVFSLHVAACGAVTDGQQKPLLRHWALLRSWHSSCLDTHMIIATVPPGKNTVLTGVYKCAAFFEETAPERVMSSEYRRSRTALTSNTQTHASTCNMAKEKKPVSISRLWQRESQPYGAEMTTLDFNDGLYEECSQTPNYNGGKSMHLHSWEILKDFPRSRPGLRERQMVSGLCCCLWPLPGNSFRKLS